MTTIDSIQMNIHYTKVLLNKSKRVISTDPLQKLNNEGAIAFYTKELKDLKFSLNCAIKQNS